MAWALEAADLLCSEPFVQDPVDQKHSTARCKMGILMAVHPDLLEIGLSYTSNYPDRARMNNLLRDYS